MSYITNPILVQRIVDFLELQKITSKSINVLVFGQSNSISKNSVLENQKYHEKILINTYAVPLICNPLKVFDIKGYCFGHLKGSEFVDCFDGGGQDLCFDCE